MHYILSNACKFRAESLNRASETCGSKRCTIIYCSYALFNGTVGKIVFTCISNSVLELVALLIGFLERAKGKCCSGRRY